MRPKITSIINSIAISIFTAIIFIIPVTSVGAQVKESTKVYTNDDLAVYTKDDLQEEKPQVQQETYYQTPPNDFYKKYSPEEWEEYPEPQNANTQNQPYTSVPTSQISYVGVIIVTDQYGHKHYLKHKHRNLQANMSPHNNGNTVHNPSHTVPNQNTSHTANSPSQRTLSTQRTIPLQSNAAMNKPMPNIRKSPAIPQKTKTPQKLSQTP